MLLAVSDRQPCERRSEATLLVPGLQAKLQQLLEEDPLHNWFPRQGSGLLIEILLLQKIPLLLLDNLPKSQAGHRL